VMIAARRGGRFPVREIVLASSAVGIAGPKLVPGRVAHPASEPPKICQARTLLATRLRTR
jgi:hypothetical protein